MPLSWTCASTVLLATTACHAPKFAEDCDVLRSTSVLLRADPPGSSPAHFVALEPAMRTAPAYVGVSAGPQPLAEVLDETGTTLSIDGFVCPMDRSPLFDPWERSEDRPRSDDFESLGFFGLLFAECLESAAVSCW